MSIVLAPMTAADFASWRDSTIPQYADEKVKNGTWEPTEALGRAQDDFTRLLPAGQQTPNHHFWTVAEAATNRGVGYIWLWQNQHRAYLYDISIHSSARRQGYGRQAMRQLEVKARELGCDAINLHVFAHNAAARALYAELGYEVTDLNLRLTLRPPAT
jgi:ribosomal protein S18 acetylase RimI-like enzyme